MQPQGKIVVASQHYPPDPSTTVAIMAEIACHLAEEHEVVVLSGSPGALPASQTCADKPRVIAVKNRMAGKAALVWRGLSELLFVPRIFVALLWQLWRADVALTVTAPFMLPYAVAAAARLKRARSALIMHDLFPDVLVMAGLLNAFDRGGRDAHCQQPDVPRAQCRYRHRPRRGSTAAQLFRTRNKICFTLSWATRVPAVLPVTADNPFRKTLATRFIVDLSGNLGFTHDPEIVFQAARLLKDEADVGFLLSGWGIGIEQLKQLQAEANLPNVSFVARVEDVELEVFLAAADLWMIPHRKDVAGVSVPGPFYNLLAVGRPVVLVSEPEAEAAPAMVEDRLGWGLTLGRADRLAGASRSVTAPWRSARHHESTGLSRAMNAHRDLIDELLRNPGLAEQR